MIYIVNLGEGVILKSRYITRKNGHPSTQQVMIKVSVGDILGLDAISSDKYKYTFKVMLPTK